MSQPIDDAGTPPPGTMRAAVWDGPDTITVRDVPMPDVPDGWVLVGVEYTGICGTDLSIVHGSHPRARAGVVPGHEIVGVVADAGTTGLSPGSRVVAEPLISCGECRACRSGSPHVCRDLKLFGIDAPGSLAGHVALPATALHVLPADVPARHAALVEPLAVAVHAVSRSGMQAGDTVAVLGGGPIGVLTALVARESGAEQVVVVEPRAWRRNVIAGLGLDVVPEGVEPAEHIAALTGGEGADTTFDAAGHPAVAAQLPGVTRVLGRIVVVGVYKQPAPVDLQAVCFKEQSLVGVRVYTRDDVARAVRLVADGELGLDRLPVAVFPLDDVAAAFDSAAAGEDNLKVLVRSGGTR
ncbi:zinc-binding dehydrogenase [Isoptericola sp. BMS4]|uniref:zinc-dependent alcohol dehydrogenase n=1 Tax=Isoptericola sp. BMS4 TaxID=2527875 RepID=UPI0014225269|nr:alcohol dehydrogenase catalytic domain-containing protein [Isoptericola sp. BMS4]